MRGLCAAPAGRLVGSLVVREQRWVSSNCLQLHSRELPQLSSGPDAGYPRAYAVALELIAHVDGRIDLECLNSFIGAYRPVHPLKLGELWAIPRSCWDWP